MKLAVAILSWNGKHWLEKFLPKVIKYADNADIYVIDNASDDNSVEFLQSNFPSIKIVLNKKNNGFAGGYNEGLKHIDADIFCLLNSDIEVTENWTIPIIELLKKDENIAAIQPKILDYNRREYFEFAGAAGGQIDNLGYPFCRGRLFDKTEKDQGQYNDETEIFWASGACFFIRSKVFFEQNGFDERFFAHQEEIDLCWRLINSGNKIFYTHQSVVYHVGGGTLKKENPKKTYLNFRNNLSMLLKNLPTKDLFWILPFRIFLDGLAGLQLGFKEGFPHTWAVIKAHFWFYKEIPRTLKLRSKIQTSKYYQKKWIVFKHFL